MPVGLVSPFLPTQNLDHKPHLPHSFSTCLLQVLLVGAVLVILDKAQALGLALQEVPKEDHALGDLLALATLATDIPLMVDHRRCTETVVHPDHKDHQGLGKLVQGSTDHCQALDPNAK